MKIGVRTLWVIIIFCNTIDLLISYGLWTGYIAVTGGAFEANPIVSIIENNGVLVLPDLVSLKIIELSIIYWITKLTQKREILLKIAALISILVVIYEIFILPRLSAII